MDLTICHFVSAGGKSFLNWNFAFILIDRILEPAQHSATDLLNKESANSSDWSERFCIKNIFCLNFIKTFYHIVLSSSAIFQATSSPIFSDIFFQQITVLDAFSKLSEMKLLKPFLNIFSGVSSAPDTDGWL